MRKNLMFIALATIGLASCKGGFKQGEGGLLYDIHTDKSGATIKPGDFISMSLIVKTDGDSVLFNSYEQGRPVPNLMPKENKKGDISAAFLLLSEGDSATVKTNIDSIFKKGAPRPPGLKGKYVIYEVKVEKVIPRGNLSEAVFNGRISEYFKVQTAAVTKAEPGKIKKYVADKGIKATVTASGLNYEITKPGAGPNIAVGDTAVVNYTGKTIEGKIFDSSIKADMEASKKPVDPRRRFEPLRIPVGEGRVIKGWDEGLQLLNKGSKATFVIPSNLGWGEQGFPPEIKPFAIVVFTVEIMDIVKANPNAPKTAMPQPPAAR